jgi:SHS2 domain-containing protein
MPSGGGFELLEHTADIGIHAWAPAPPEAFEQAARGLAEVMGVHVRGSGRRHRLTVRARDREGLLVAFLNELVWLHETESKGFSEIDVVAVSPNDLVAEVELAPLPDAPEGIGVKAATYHQLRVEERPGGGLDVRVYLDV